jgi:phage major head subunit gpT-like protein
MTISGNVPQHLVVGARTGFLTAVSETRFNWQTVAGLINMTGKSQDLVDLGAAPMPVEDLGGGPMRHFIEKSVNVKPRNWVVKVGISYNAVQDDQTSSLFTKVRSAGENFQRAINNLVFKALDAGDASTYGLCYDGLTFFNDAHVDKGAHYQTAQDNLFANAASVASWNTGYVLAKSFRDDQGEFVDHEYNIFLTSPTLRDVAFQVCGNPQKGGQANFDINSYLGVSTPLINPNIGSTCYMGLCTTEVAKPIYVAMREEPSLQDYGFDPDAADGGEYWFKFYSRYNVVYGDWRLAFLGAT